MITSAVLVALALQQPLSQDSPLDALRYLARHQLKDGSWGEILESCKCQFDPPPPSTSGSGGSSNNLRTTGLVLIAFMRAGFNSTSKDTYDDRCLGDIVNRGLERILKAQTKEGAFDQDRVTNAIAALAIVEHYRLTHNGLENAERAIAFVEANLGKDALELIWQGLVVKAAIEGEIAKGAQRALLSTVLSRMLESKDELAGVGGVLIGSWTDTPSKADAIEKLYAADVAKTPPALLEFICLAAHSADHHGERWQEWHRNLQNTLKALQRVDERQCDRGSWASHSIRESLESTAFRVMSLSQRRCYTCRNVFRDR